MDTLTYMRRLQVVHETSLRSRFIDILRVTDSDSTKTAALLCECWRCLTPLLLGIDVSFGHARLSILDLSEHGKQPMTKDGFTITYNGEVYNYPDLRSSLHRARPNLVLESTSDIEVVLRVLEHCMRSHAGEGYPNVSPQLNIFNGFFAFALWDSVRKHLLLVRDRYGIKPLYYYHQKGKFFAFASEVETLLASKLFHPLVDLDTLHLFCSISTFFANTSLPQTRISYFEQSSNEHPPQTKHNNHLKKLENTQRALDATVCF